MANVQVAPPFSFSVAPAQRQGTFSTPVFQLTAPASTIYWELDIPLTSDYENTADTVTAQLFVNGVDSSTTWRGGRVTNKQGAVDPAPAIAYDISGLPVGTTYQVVITVPNSMDIGIQNGLIS